MRTLSIRWLRLCWILPAFVPLAAISTPIAAPFISYVWLACAVYLWPASKCCQLLGIPVLGGWWFAVSFIYSLAVGLLVDQLVYRISRFPERVSLSRMIRLCTILWLPIVVFVGYRLLVYKAVLQRTTVCPGNIAILAPYCSELTELREYVLGGFIDVWYLARFKERQGLMQRIASERKLVEIDQAQIPDSVWDMPPWWWHPRKSQKTRVYSTQGFSLSGRGSDGDHYLFFEDMDSGNVHVFYKSNF